MKSLKTITLLTFASLSTLATVIKPVSAQNIYDPWTGATVDTTECNYYYDQCWVGSDGEVYGSHYGSSPNPATFTWDNNGTDYYPLHESNNYYAPPSSSVSPNYSSSSDSSHQKFLELIRQ